MATGRRLRKRVRRARRTAEALRAAVAAVSEQALAMEEPLRHAGHLARAILMAEQPDNDEVDAFAFVAGEAVLRIEDCQAALNAMFEALEMGVRPTP
jgi:hypothetical protein